MGMKCIGQSEHSTILGKERKFIWVVTSSFKHSFFYKTKRENKGEELGLGEFWRIFGAFWSWKLKILVVMPEE